MGGEWGQVSKHDLCGGDVCINPDTLKALKAEHEAAQQALRDIRSITLRDICCMCPACPPFDEILAACKRGLGEGVSGPTRSGRQIIGARIWRNCDEKNQEYLITEHELRQVRWTLHNALSVLRLLEHTNTKKTVRVPLRVAIDAIAEVESRLRELSAADS